MRGKGKSIAAYFARNRITPAYAGKSTTCYKHRHCDRDHPRLCGEKHSVTLYRDHVVRITPAYAGKSPQSLYDAAQERDHPRLCGEKSNLHKFPV